MCFFSIIFVAKGKLFCLHGHLFNVMGYVSPSLSSDGHKEFMQGG